MAYETKTQIAVRALRKRIQSGEIRAGERLKLQALTDELGMSPTPIREALRLLESDGLIVYHPHVGIEVAQLTDDEVDEIYALRELLEPLAVRLAVPRLDEETLERLEQLQRDVTRARSRRGRGMSEANAEWHWTIYREAEGRYLSEFIRRLWELFPWRTTWTVSDRLEAMLDEHEAVMGAIRAGDADRAAEAMRVHIANSRHLVFSGLVDERVLT